MAIYYKEENEVYKCKKHTSKQHNNNTDGICPHCLKDRLTLLCPNCANLKPCSCLTACPSSSSSDSSTFSFNFDTVSNLVNNEPAFTSNPNPRTIFPFFRSARFSENVPPNERRNLPLPLQSVWSIFRRGSSKLARSKSVVHNRGNNSNSSSNNRWYFASPMKIFRHVKASKVAHQRSPLH